MGITFFLVNILRVIKVSDYRCVKLRFSCFMRHLALFNKTNQISFDLYGRHKDCAELTRKWQKWIKMSAYSRLNLHSSLLSLLSIYSILRLTHNLSYMYWENMFTIIYEILSRLKNKISTDFLAFIFTWVASQNQKICSLLRLRALHLPC